MIEFPNISDSLYSRIPELSELKIANRLKNQGFRVIESGKGNFTRGPRIVSKTLKKGGCFCMVSKVYYQTTVDNVFEATERLVCMDSLTYNQSSRIIKGE